MRTIVHLSDLHFGRTAAEVRSEIATTVNRIRPDLVVVSGDLTQRARTPEFREAREFLDALPSPQIVVPGNHDIPLYNLYARSFRKLDGYRRHITGELEPFFANGEIAVMGVNTARSFAFKGGRVSRFQVERICERMTKAGEKRTRILVAHHPFDLPIAFGRGAVVGRARRALQRLTRCHIDVILSGHLHAAYTADTTVRRAIAGHSALIVQAGTAISTRTRGERNSFNVLHVRRDEILVDTHFWQNERLSFERSASTAFQRTPEGWIRTAA